MKLVKVNAVRVDQITVVLPVSFSSSNSALHLCFNHTNKPLHNSLDGSQQ